MSVTTRIERCTYSADELNAMSERDYKRLEGRLRRAATQQGLRLEKSRARDPRAITFGTYHLVDLSIGAIVVSYGQNGYGLGLDDVIHALFDGEPS